MTKEKIDLLRRELTDDLLEKLVLHAKFLVDVHFWRGQRGGDVLPRGESYESIVHLTVEKLILGKIEWKPHEVDLEYFLKQAVRREVGHYSKLKENVATTTASVEAVAARSNRWPQGEEEGARWAEDFLEFLRIRREDLLVDIVECILEDADKPRMISRKLGLEGRDLYNARKRLQRALGEFLSRGGM